MNLAWQLPGFSGGKFGHREGTGKVFDRPGGKRPGNFPVFKNIFGRETKNIIVS